MQPLPHPARQPLAVANVPTPVGTQPAGYAALIAAFDLQVPAPDEMLIIGTKHTLRREGRWRVLTPRYRPSDTIAGHLEFALRHEGVDLAVINALFQAVSPAFIQEWVRAQPTSSYARRVWFLHKWIHARTSICRTRRPRPTPTSWMRHRDSPSKAKPSPAIACATTCQELPTSVPSSGGPKLLLLYSTRTWRAKRAIRYSAPRFPILSRVRPHSFF